jgi:hypothetical protein
MSRAERVAQMAREAFPDPPTTPIENAQKNVFIHQHRWEFFDPKHTGRIGLEAFIDYQWASMLAYARAGSCVVDLQEYMSYFLGPERIVEDIKSKSPEFAATYQAEAKGFEANFRSLDTGNKGYLTLQDMRRVYSSQFRAADRDGDGYLNETEFQ